MREAVVKRAGRMALRMPLTTSQCAAQQVTELHDAAGQAGRRNRKGARLGPLCRQEPWSPAGPMVSDW